MRREAGECGAGSGGGPASPAARPPSRRSRLALAPARRRTAGLLLACLAYGGPAAAQGSIVDEGSFTISLGDAVVGREDFTIRRGRSTGPDGYTISSSASYPASAPRVRLAPVVELGPDSTVVQAQFDIFGGGQRRIYVQLGPRRVTFRIVRPGGESARELPAAGPAILVEDSTCALYALLPLGLGHLAALAVLSGERLSLQIDDRGRERTTIQGVAHQLHHVVLSLGGEARHLWYDARGRLMRVDLPAAGLVAERSPGPP